MRRHSRTGETHQHILAQRNMWKHFCMRPCTEHSHSVKLARFLVLIITISDHTYTDGLQCWSEGQISIQTAQTRVTSTTREPQSSCLEPLLAHGETNGSDSRRKDEQLTVLLCPSHLLPLTHQWYCCHPCKAWDKAAKSILEYSQEPQRTFECSVSAPASLEIKSA